MTAGRYVLPALLAAALACGCNPFSSSTSSEMSAEDAAAFEAAREKQLQIEREQAKHASYAEIKVIRPGAKTPFKNLSALGLTKDGNLLACDAGTSTIHVLNQDGESVAKWKLSFAPQALAIAPDGTIFVAGPKVLAKLDAEGKVTKQTKLSGKSVAAATASDKDIFVSIPAGTGFTVTRFSHELEEPKSIVSGLRGCCGILDICWHDGKLYAAENGRFRVVSYDRDGKQLGKWGEGDREDVAKFAGCCNPKNLCLSSDGRIYVAESSPDRIKRYSADGKYEELIGWFTGREGCWGVDLVSSADGKRLYYADSTANFVRVLEPKPAAEHASQSTAAAEVKP
ncbi:MAG: hypothetical protein AMXMBFR47_02080 [Planctomycetota bacterium]